MAFGSFDGPEFRADWADISSGEDNSKSENDDSQINKSKTVAGIKSQVASAITSSSFSVTQTKSSSDPFSILGNIVNKRSGGIKGNNDDADDNQGASVFTETRGLSKVSTLSEKDSDKQLQEIFRKYFKTSTTTKRRSTSVSDLSHKSLSVGEDSSNQPVQSLNSHTKPSDAYVPKPMALSSHPTLVSRPGLGKLEDPMAKFKEFVAPKEGEVKLNLQLSVL